MKRPPLPVLRLLAAPQDAAGDGGRVSGRVQSRVSKPRVCGDPEVQVKGAGGGGSVDAGHPGPGAPQLQ